jgi:hypothetical protein
MQRSRIVTGSAQRRAGVSLVVATSCLVALGATTAAAVAGIGPVDLDRVRAYAVAHGLEPNFTARAGSEVPILGATPRATCGPGSTPETGRQGRVSSTDYATGRAADGYTCNTELVGRFGQTGGFQVHRYVDAAGHECAFYDSTLVFPKDAYKGQDTGTYVLDMSDPANPVRTAVLRTPAMQSPHESLRLNSERGLLVAGMGSPSTQLGFVDVYDVSQDCRTPVLESSLPLGGLGHEGGFSADGLTYWVTTTAREGITAIDLTDPSTPQVVWRSDQWASHGMSLSADGTRAYLASPCCDYVSATTKGGGGLIVLDVSEVQNRVSKPTVREVSRLTWPEVTIPQNTIPVTISGHPYVIEFDEFSSNVFVYGEDDHVGGVRLIDMAGEGNPEVVSRIRLEVHEREARADSQQEDPGAQRVGQGYAAHYCSVPQQVEPGVLACGMILSGLRVFDIRDPLNPREIAYFNQPRTEGLDSSERGAYAMAAPAFVPERGEIWYADANTGFFSVRLTNGVWPAAGAAPAAGATGTSDTVTEPAVRPAPAAATETTRARSLPATGGLPTAALAVALLVLAGVTGWRLSRSR